VKKIQISASFDTFLQTGRRMMPAFKQIEEQDRKAIASCIEPGGFAKRPTSIRR
jgi:hypothetical protein